MYVEVIQSQGKVALVLEEGDHHLEVGPTGAMECSCGFPRDRRWPAGHRRMLLCGIDKATEKGAPLCYLEDLVAQL